jgi:hypothetical protein
MEWQRYRHRKIERAIGNKKLETSNQQQLTYILFQPFPNYFADLRILTKKVL